MFSVLFFCGVDKAWLSLSIFVYGVTSKGVTMFFLGVVMFYLQVFLPFAQVISPPLAVSIDIYSLVIVASEFLFLAGVMWVVRKLIKTVNRS